MFMPYPSRQFFPVSSRHFLASLFIITVVVILLVQHPLISLPPQPHFNPTSLTLNIQPLSFAPNAGQTNPVVRFQTRGLGGGLFFTLGEVVLSLSAASKQDGPAVVRLRFEGANSTPEVVGLEPLPGRVNYFYGNKPDHWHTNLPTYAGVVYRQLYPGIDLRFDGTSSRLKGTYTLAPNVNPGLIRWRYEGVEKMQVDEDSGNLRLTLTADPLHAEAPTLIEYAPVAWQEFEGQRAPVKVQYHLQPDNSLSFTLGEYNPAYPLTIDPTLTFSTYHGGSGYENANGIALDGTGNIYIIGETDSTNFPTQNPLYPTLRNNWDVFVTKFDPTGSTLLYSTYIGGTNLDTGNDIAVDSAGNAYITGEAGIGIGLASDFPTTPGAYDRTIEAVSAFVAKLNPMGSQLLYSTYLGGPSINEGLGIAIDSSDNAYVIGVTNSTSFPTQNAFQSTYGGGLRDAFVTKLNPSGSALVYSTYLGGSDQETTLDTFGAGIAVDSSGNAYVASATRSNNFPTTAGALNTTLGGSSDAFVTKFNASGNGLVYSTYLGGSGSLEYAYDLAINSAGEAYVTGTTNSSNFPTQNPLQAHLAGGGDLFVSKLSTTGGSLLYSTYLGGGAGDFGISIALDSAENIYVTGNTTSINFPLQNSFQSTQKGGLDAFVVKLNPTGNALLFGTYLGGNLSDQGNAIAADNVGNIYIAGQARSTNFPVQNARQPSYGNGAADAFVVKIDAGSEVYLPVVLR